MQESAQIVVSLGKSSKFATNLTNSQLRRPKSDLVHEKTMLHGSILPLLPSLISVIIISAGAAFRSGLPSFLKRKLKT